MGRRGTIALVVGGAMLVIGVVLAVVFHDRDDTSAAEEARYDRVLRDAAAVPPRFAVSYVELPLGEARRRGARQIVRTPVGQRLLTGRPPFHPNFAALARDRTDPGARLFKEGVVTERRVSVVGLAVTQVTPGEVESLELDVEHMTIDGFVFVWDLLDLLPEEDVSIFKPPREGPTRREVVAWKPRYSREAFVPLAFFHLFRIPKVPRNAELIEALGGLQGYQVTSHVALGPLRLRTRTTSGGETGIPLTRALSPLVQTPGVRP